MTSEYFEISNRQQRLVEALGDDLLIVPAGSASGAISRFRQASNFFYLTGFPEHGAVLVIDPGDENGAVNLFIRENDERETIWDGFTMGVEKTAANYPADTVSHINDLEAFLEKRLHGRCLHYRPAEKHPFGSVIGSAIREQNPEVSAEGAIFDLIVEMRMVKSPAEIEHIRKAVAITRAAMHACMRAGTRHRMEYQFEAELEYHFRKEGALHNAFGTIVAAGSHATCQHYIENDGPVGEDDLILIDGGAVWQGYCGDLTRTFPASGTFSTIQRELYEVVLASEKAGIEKVAPGVCMIDIHKHAAAVLIDGLKEMKLLHGDTEELIESERYKEIWPGALCHALGIDVHDVTLPGYPKGDRPLKPGMVITVEPGFYSQAFNEAIPEAYRGIGIRIEDNVLVTEDGHENLSIDTVKEVSDVEALVQSGRAADSAHPTSLH